MSFRPATGANWLAVLCAAQAVAEPAVLVTVARAEGSTPRPPGARMVVGRDWQADTIGGGMLEFRAIDEARAILSQVAADAAARGECACACRWARALDSVAAVSRIWRLS